MVRHWFRLRAYVIILKHWFRVVTKSALVTSALLFFLFWKIFWVVFWNWSHFNKGRNVAPQVSSQAIGRNSCQNDNCNPIFMQFEASASGLYTTDKSTNKWPYWTFTQFCWDKTPLAHDAEFYHELWNVYSIVTITIREGCSKAAFIWVDKLQNSIFKLKR